MQFTLDEIKYWLINHWDWVIPCDDDITTPVASFKPEELKRIVDEQIIPNLSMYDRTSRSLHEIIVGYWHGSDALQVTEGGIHPIEKYMNKRNAFKIIEAMHDAFYPLDEIRDVLAIVLRLDSVDVDGKHHLSDEASKLIDIAIERYNYQSKDKQINLKEGLRK